MSRTRRVYSLDKSLSWMSPWSPKLATSPTSPSMRWGITAGNELAGLVTCP